MFYISIQFFINISHTETLKYTGYSTVGSGDAAASPSKNFRGQNWLDLGKIKILAHPKNIRSPTAMIR